MALMKVLCIMAAVSTIVATNAKQTDITSPSESLRSQTTSQDLTSLMQSKEKKVIIQSEKALEKLSVSTSRPQSVNTLLTMANKTVIDAKLALEVIDSFKDGFVSALLNRTWEEADGAYHTGYLNESYLPVPPLEVPYNPQELIYELRRSYSLMQHCVVSLEILNLDQVLEKSAYTYFGNVSKVSDQITVCLDDLKVYMESESCSPNGQETRAMTSMIYNDVSASDREARDFIILRDVRASLQNIVETFRHF